MTTLDAVIASAAEQLIEHGFAKVPQVLTPGQVTRFRRLREHTVDGWRYASGVAERPVFVPGVLFGFFPNGAYNQPLALICFIYIQPMTSATGPLRVLPGSHRDAGALEPAQRSSPLPGEILIDSLAGDAVVIHHNLLHSGSVNTSEYERQFLGHVYTLTSFRAEDDSFDGPLCRALRASARRTGDRRLARLLGDDEQLGARQNAGFVKPPAADWAAWRDEDQAHACHYRDEHRWAYRVRSELDPGQAAGSGQSRRAGDGEAQAAGWLPALRPSLC